MEITITAGMHLAESHQMGKSIQSLFLFLKTTKKRQKINNKQKSVQNFVVPQHPFMFSFIIIISLQLPETLVYFCFILHTCFCLGFNSEYYMLTAVCLYFFLSLFIFFLSSLYFSDDRRRRRRDIFSSLSLSFSLFV